MGGTEEGELTADDLTNIVKIESLPAWRNCSVLVPPRTQIPGDGCVLPFWQRTSHKRWHQILRMGERKGHDQVQDNEFRSSHRCIERQQLPDKMGGLNLRSG